ncbi:tetratricopeptide repeat protein [Kribbella soli]|uniref:Tetratricopeptide repeat protein n=1 Tax=Kribbella soli TaxID=1124743 RepID=A0A4V2LZG7_9ACTN|nr:hypothetical protein [Kribbella soli]TCC08096.1 hypothetical protein E0H45_19450 [Kribbella soli]
MTYEQVPPPPPQGTPYPGRPPKRLRPHDPLAVALGNASLLGLGYFLIRRWFFGILGLAGTAVLLVLMYQRKDAAYQFGLIAWGLLQVLHGLFLATRAPERTASIPKRIVAAVITLAVVASGVVLKRDAADVADRVTAARRAGDCAKVVQAQGEVWFGDRLVSGKDMDRGDGDVETCGRLDTARGHLSAAAGLTDVSSLRQGYDILGPIASDPRQQATAGVVMDRFVKDLQAMEPCAQITMTAWLRTRKLSSTLLDRANAVVPRIEPNALLACADGYASRENWVTARATYQRLIATYPKAKQTARARAGLVKATLAIELDNVRSLLLDGAYCSSPAKYSGAKPYHRGFNPAVFLGDGSQYADQLPAAWSIDDPYRATIIVCTDTPGMGAAVQTCPYVPETNPYGGEVTYVTFRKVTVPTKVYELRTGRLVASATVQMSGEACPYRLSSSSTDVESVTPSDAQVQAAFRPFVVRP